jgi:hypothetical protein
MQSPLLSQHQSLMRLVDKKEQINISINPTGHALIYVE